MFFLFFGKSETGGGHSGALVAVWGASQKPGEPLGGDTLYLNGLQCICAERFVLYCSVVLYCIVLDWIVLYFIVLCCIVLDCIGLCCIALHCVVLYRIVLLCNIVYYSVGQCCIAQ
jgi:hypothetical protein